MVFEEYPRIGSGPIQLTEETVEVKTLYKIQFFSSEWGTMKYGVLHTSILCPLLFIIYKNYLLLRINSASEPVLYAGDTSVIISRRNIEDFHSMSKFDLCHMIKRFPANTFVPNLDVIYIIKFITKN